MRVIVLSLLLLASSIATTASPPHQEAQPDDPPPHHETQPDDPPPLHEAQPDDPPPQHLAQPDDPPPQHEAQHDASPGGSAAPPREVLTAQPTTTGGAADARDSPSPPSESAADAPPTKKGLPLKLALRAARPWSFSATATPVALGTALAFQVEDKFRLVRLVLTLVTTLSVHAAGNLMNTYFDFVHGVDKPGATSDTTLVNGELQPSQVAHLVMWSYGIAAAAAAPLCAVSKAPLRQLLAHLAAGAASAFVYTGGPGLKYKALGDLLISATFGPLLVSFAYLVQAGKTSWRTVLASLPLTAHIEAILHANNARDVEEDLANGVATLAAALGRRLSSALYALLMAAPFAAALAHAWWRSFVSALPLLSAPVGMSLVKDFYRQRMKDLPKRTAKFQLLFGVLLVMSVLIPSPSLQALLRRAL